MRFSLTSCLNHDPKAMNSHDFPRCLDEIAPASTPQKRRRTAQSAGRQLGAHNGEGQLSHGHLQQQLVASDFSPSPHGKNHQKSMLYDVIVGE